MGFLIFFGAGLFLIVAGFRAYRQSRLMKDTPIAPIGSISMGLVHLRGKATGEERLTSPLTHTPSFYYQVQVEEWRPARRRNRWQGIGAHSAEHNFYLDDGTGKVLVDPHLAQLDVTMTYQGGLGPATTGTAFIDPSLGGSAPKAEELQSCLDALPQKVAAKLQELRSAGTAGKLLASLAGSGRPLGRRTVEISSSGISIDSGYGKPSFRFTESCLIADREHTILGTCVEVAHPKDGQDRKMILKGENGAAYFITSRSEKEEESTLKRGAIIGIVCGAAFMIAAVAMLVL